MEQDLRVYFKSKLDESLGVGCVVRPFQTLGWNVFFINRKYIFGNTQQIDVDGFILCANGVLIEARIHQTWNTAIECTECVRLFHFFDVGKFYHVCCSMLSFDFSETPNNDILLVGVVDKYLIKEKIVHAEVACNLHNLDYEVVYDFELYYKQKKDFVSVFDFDNVIEFV